MANFDGANFVLKATCPSNEIILDDKGLPSIMVYVPKFKISDVLEGGSDSTHPAFIVNGREVPGVYISKYQNVVYNNRAYSLPGEDPRVSITFDGARQACEAKGPGWHLMTNAEWAALALWCRKNNCMPKGNNDFGKDSTETGYIAVPASYGSDGRVNRVRTGTGPKTWSHNGEADGIYDLNGNVSEWVGGMRTVYGEIQILAHNDAADANNQQSESSVKWMAIKASDGSLIKPNGTGTTSDSLKLDYLNNKWTLCTSITNQSNSPRNCSFADMVLANGIPCPEILIAHGLYPADNGNHGNDDIYFNNGAPECIARRGGYWYGGAHYGIFLLGCGYLRSSSSSYLGFRSAHIPGM